MDDAKNGTGSRSASEVNLVDMTLDEAKAVALIQAQVNRKYELRPATVENIVARNDELRTRMYDAGFEVVPSTMRGGIQCWDIVRRTDAKRQAYLNEHGSDAERQGWDSSHESSAELKRKGIDPGLMVG